MATSVDGRGGGASIPTVPGGAVSQIGPTETRQTQRFLGAMGIPGYAPPPRPRGPYATGYMGRQEQLAQQYRANTLSALQGRPGTAYVFIGADAKTKNAFKSIDELVSDFESSSNESKKRMARLLAMAGYIPIGAGGLAETVEETTLMEVTAAYGELLGSAAARFAQGQTVTPDQLLEMNIRYNYGKVKGAESLDLDSLYNTVTKKSKPKTVVTEDRHIDIFSADDARGLARATLQNALGRDPTEDEYEDFVSALNTAARNNPTITTTRTRYDAEGDVKWQRSQTEGGLTEAGVDQVLQEEAESTPGYAEWQAVGTYFPAVMQSLGSAVPGV